MGMFFDCSYVIEGFLLLGSGFANTFLQNIKFLVSGILLEKLRVPLSNRNTMTVIYVIDIFLVTTLKKKVERTR